MDAELNLVSHFFLLFCFSFGFDFNPFLICCGHGLYANMFKAIDKARQAGEAVVDPPSQSSHRDEQGNSSAEERSSVEI